jgi:general secretion pathway protein K
MRKRERGAAIVLALSVVALAALAASAMMVSQGVWIRQIELSAGRSQGNFIIQAGVDWARAVLNHDRHTSDVDHLGEPWALRLPSIPLENGNLAGNLAGYIEDQQARFNLNNLLKNGNIDPAQLAIFRRLLSILGLQPVSADMLANWMDAGRRPLVDVSELARLGSFDEGTRARLGPFVTVLPHFTAVNVNTAAPEVLAAVVKGLGLDGARALVVQRDRAYFRSGSEFLGRLPNTLTVSAENISVTSGYFMATIHANVGGTHSRSLALLAHGETGSWPTIVWRKYL